MIIKTKTDKDNSEVDNPQPIVSKNAQQINSNLNLALLTRGFNQFLLYGMSQDELHILRLSFHTSIYNQYLQRNLQLDWSYDALLQREEDWLRAQMNNATNSNRIVRNPFLSLIIRGGDDIRMRERERRPLYDEPNICFIQGFICGILLNIFSIIFLIMYSFKRKFKLGMQIGMVIGISIFLIPFLTLNKV